MEVLERNTVPAFQMIESIKIIEANKFELNNDIPVYMINAGTQDLIRIEFIFPAGNWQETQKLQALFTNKMINKGTSEWSAAEIADKFEFYGAHIKLSSTADNASVVLYTLNKYLDEVLPVLASVLNDAIFPESEIEIIRDNKKQKLAVNKLRMDYLAKNKFEELVFGVNHPYGYDPTLENYNYLSVEHVQEFYQARYQFKNSKIIVAGKVDDTKLKLIDKYFGLPFSTNGVQTGQSKIKGPNAVTQAQSSHLIERNDSLQSAVVLGCLSISNTHPDYFGLKVLTAILGGYFGSRLMKNVREDKGFTYGIHAYLRVYKHASCFTISTEVNADVTRATLDEIYFELKRLRDEKLPEHELELVRNYMIGSFMSAIDGPFELAKIFKAILLHDLDYNHYHEFIENIRLIKSEQIQDLANKYLDKDSMHEVIAGKL